MPGRLSRRTLLGALALGPLAAACGTGAQSKGAPVTDPSWSDATALTGAEDSPHSLAVDDAHAYFATGGSQVGENAVRVVPLDGSAPSRILMPAAADRVPGDALVVDGDHLYVAAGSDILRVAIADGGTEVVVAGRPATVRGIAVSGGALWWTTSQLNTPSAAELCRLPLAGGAVQILAAGPESAQRPYTRDAEERRAVAVPRLTSVSALTPDGSGGVLAACPLGLLHAGTGQANLAVARDEPVSQVAVGGTTAYFLDQDGLYAVPLAGGAVTSLAGSLDTGSSLVVSGDRAYGATLRGLGSGDSAVLAYSLSGGDAVILSHGPFPGGHVAVAGSRVAFIGDSRVWTAPVPAVTTREGVAATP